MQVLSVTNEGGKVLLSCACYSHTSHVHWLAGAEAAVSMKRIVAHLRKQRIGMVQTVQQYVFIYQALYDEIQEAFSRPQQAAQPLSRASGSSQG